MAFRSWLVRSDAARFSWPPAVTIVTAKFTSRSLAQGGDRVSSRWRGFYILSGEKAMSKAAESAGQNHTGLILNNCHVNFLLSLERMSTGKPFNLLS